MDSHSYLIRSLFRFCCATSLLAIGVYATLVVTIPQVSNILPSEWDYVAAYIPSVVFILITAANLNEEAHGLLDFLIPRLLLCTFCLYVSLGYVVMSFLTMPFLPYIRMVIGPLMVFTGVCFAVRYQACAWYYANRLP